MPTTPLYYCPCIVYGVTRFWLPPWIKVKTSQAQLVSVIPIPNTNTAVVGEVSRNQGTRISISLTYLPDGWTQAEILEEIKSIWDNLGGREFTFFEYSDRGWPQCYLTAWDQSTGMDVSSFLSEAGLEIISLRHGVDTGSQLTFTDFASEYPYAAKVGRPSGSAIVPEEETPLMQSISPYSGTFHGVAESGTPTGEEQRIIVGGAAGTQFQLIGIQISAAENYIADGTSKVTVSTVAKGTPSGGQSATATVAQGSLSGAVTSAAITVAAGATLYVYIPDDGAGSHQNITYQLHLKAL